MDKPPDDSSFVEKPKKRKRGAQPGNINALKHGFYSRYFTQNEHNDLEGQPALDSEIDMLRVAIQRLFSRTAEADEKTLTNSLNALARASASLARIIEANRRIRGQENEIVNTINLAVSQINQELSSKRRSTPRRR
jgi:uncharacterized phage infection (PIP) family protein YhgE